MPSERLRDILPLLRPRSAEPTLFTQTVFGLLCLGLATLALLYGLARLGVIELVGRCQAQARKISFF